MKVQVGKHLFDTFLIQNVLKQGDALSPLFLCFTVTYATRNFPAHQGALSLNVVHQFPLCAHDISLLGENTRLLHWSPVRKLY